MHAPFFFKIKWPVLMLSCQVTSCGHVLLSHLFDLLYFHWSEISNDIHCCPLCGLMWLSLKYSNVKCWDIFSRQKSLLIHSDYNKNQENIGCDVRPRHSHHFLYTGGCRQSGWIDYGMLLASELHWDPNQWPTSLLLWQPLALHTLGAGWCRTKQHSCSLRALSVPLCV